KKSETYTKLKHKFDKHILEKRKEKKSEVTDPHEAVRPTSTLRTPQDMNPYLSRDQYRLYKLVWDRFVASLMAPAVLDTVRVDLNNNGVIFRSNGSTIKIKGFLQIGRAHV